MADNYWLLKCEPRECTFAELKTRPGRIGHWRGVRNYEARNLIRDRMRRGDLAFFYHSNCEQPGVAGIVQIAREAYPDPSQFDPEGRYHDAKATPETPRWCSFDVRWHQPLAGFVPLSALKANAALSGMRVVQRGQRLSIQPVTAAEWRAVCRMGGIEPPA